MALNKNNTFDIDDTSFLNAGDDFSFDLDTEMDVDESKAKKVARSVFDGMKQISKGAADGVRAALHQIPGYSTVDNTTEETIGVIKDISSKTTEELGKLRQSAHRVAANAVLKYGKYTPERFANLRDTLKRKIVDTYQAPYVPETEEESRERYNTDTMNLALTNIFEDGQKREAARERRRRTESAVEQVISHEYHKDLVGGIGSIAETARGISGFLRGTYMSFLKKDLELKYRSYFVAKENLIYVKGIASVFDKRLQEILTAAKMPDQEKMTAYRKTLTDKRNERSKNATFGGWTRNYLSEYRKKTTESISLFTTMLSSALDTMGMYVDPDMDFDDGTPVSKKILDKGLNILGSFIGKRITNRFLKSRTDVAHTLGEDLKDFVAGMPSKINTLTKKRHSSAIMNMLASLLPGFTRHTEVDNEAATNPRDAATFDNLTRESIISVIPAHLERIGACIESVMKFLGASVDESSKKTYSIQDRRLITFSEQTDRINAMRFGSKTERSLEAERQKNVLLNNILSRYNLGSKDEIQAGSAAEKELTQLNNLFPALRRSLSVAGYNQLSLDPEILKDFAENGATPQNYRYIQELLGGTRPQEQELAKFLVQNISRNGMFDNSQKRGIEGVIREMERAHDKVYETSQTVGDLGMSRFDNTIVYDDAGKAYISKPGIIQEAADVGTRGTLEKFDPRTGKRTRTSVGEQNRTLAEELIRRREEMKRVQEDHDRIRAGYLSSLTDQELQDRYGMTREEVLGWLESTGFNSAGIFGTKALDLMNPFSRFQTPEERRKKFRTIARLEKPEDKDIFADTMKSMGSTMHKVRDIFTKKKSNFIVQSITQRDAHSFVIRYVDDTENYIRSANVTLRDAITLPPDADGPDAAYIKKVTAAVLKKCPVPFANLTDDQILAPSFFRFVSDREDRDDLESLIENQNKYMSGRELFSGGTEGSDRQGRIRALGQNPMLEATQDIAANVRDILDIMRSGKGPGSGPENTPPPSPKTPPPDDIMPPALPQDEIMPPAVDDRKMSVGTPTVAPGIEAPPAIANTFINPSAPAKVAAGLASGISGAVALGTKVAGWFKRRKPNPVQENVPNAEASISSEPTLSGGWFGNTVDRLKYAGERFSDRATDIIGLRRRKELEANGIYHIGPNQWFDSASRTTMTLSEAIAALDKPREKSGLSGLAKSIGEDNTIDDEFKKRLFGVLERINTSTDKTAEATEELTKETDINGTEAEEGSAADQTRDKREADEERRAKLEERKKAQEEANAKAKAAAEKRRASVEPKAGSANGGSGGMMDSIATRIVDLVGSKFLGKNAARAFAAGGVKRLTTRALLKVGGKNAARALMKGGWSGLGHYAAATPAAAAAGLGLLGAGMGFGGSRSSGASGLSTGVSTAAGATAGIAAAFSNPVTAGIATAILAGNAMREGWNDKKTLKNTWGAENVLDSQKGSTAAGNIVNYATFGLLNKLGGRKYIDKLAEVSGLGHMVGGAGGQIAGTSDVVKGIVRSFKGEDSPMTEQELKTARAQFDTDVKQNKYRAAERRDAFEQAVASGNWRSARRLSNIQVHAGKEIQNGLLRIGKGTLALTTLGVSSRIESAYTDKKPMTEKELKDAREYLALQKRMNRPGADELLDKFEQAVQTEDWETARKVSGQQQSTRFKSSARRSLRAAALSVIPGAVLFYTDQDKPLTEQEIESYKKKCEALIARGDANARTNLDRFTEAVLLGKWALARKISEIKDVSIGSKIGSALRNITVGNDDKPMTDQEIERARESFKRKLDLGDTAIKRVMDDFDEAVDYGNWRKARQLANIKTEGSVQRSARRATNLVTFFGTTLVSGDYKPMSDREVSEFRDRMNRLIENGSPVARGLLDRFEDAVLDNNWRKARAISQTKYEGIWSRSLTGIKNLFAPKEEKNEPDEKMDSTSELAQRYRLILARVNQAAGKAKMSMLDRWSLSRLRNDMQTTDFLDLNPERLDDWEKRLREIDSSAGDMSGSSISEYEATRKEKSKLLERQSNLLNEIQAAWKRTGVLRVGKQIKLRTLFNEVESLDTESLSKDLLDMYDTELRILDQNAVSTKEFSSEERKKISELMKRQTKLVSSIDQTRKGLGIFRLTDRSRLNKLRNQVESAPLEELTDEDFDLWDEELRSIDPSAEGSVERDVEALKKLHQLSRKKAVLFNLVTEARKKMKWFSDGRSTLGKLRKEIDGTSDEETDEDLLSSWNETYTSVTDDKEGVDAEVRKQEDQSKALKSRQKLVTDIKNLQRKYKRHSTKDAKAFVKKAQGIVDSIESIDDKDYLLSTQSSFEKEFSDLKQMYPLGAQAKPTADHTSTMTAPVARTIQAAEKTARVLGHVDELRTLFSGNKNPDKDPRTPVNVTMEDVGFKTIGEVNTPAGVRYQVGRFPPPLPKNQSPQDPGTRNPWTNVSGKESARMTISSATSPSVPQAQAIISSPTPSPTVRQQTENVYKGTVAIPGSTLADLQKTAKTAGGTLPKTAQPDKAVGDGLNALGKVETQSLGVQEQILGMLGNVVTAIYDNHGQVRKDIDTTAGQAVSMMKNYSDKVFQRQTPVFQRPKTSGPAVGVSRL